MDLEQARTDLAEALRQKFAGAELVVATDPKFAHAPCVLVGPITDIEIESSCSMLVTIPVLLIGRKPANENNLAVLHGLLPGVVDAIQAVGEVTEAEIGTMDVGQGDLPAFLIPTTHVVKE